MPSNKKPRKEHKPKKISSNPIDWAIAGVHTFPVTTQKEILRHPEAAFVKLRNGVANRDDWNQVTQALNIGEALTELHIGDNLLDAINAGHEAMHQVALRLIETNKSTCYAHELAAIREALDMYAIQIRLCTQAEFSRALALVKNRLSSGKNENKVIVYERMNRPR